MFRPTLASEVRAPEVYGIAKHREGAVRERGGDVVLHATEVEEKSEFFGMRTEGRETVSTISELSSKTS